MSADARPWPVKLTLARDKRMLSVAFDDGRAFDLPAEYLRVMTGSAQDRGHGAGPRPPLGGKQQVAIADIRPIGAYAVRLVFDDGHDSGLYSWDLLYDLGAERPARWAAYLEGLKAAGMARAPQAGA